MLQQNIDGFKHINKRAAEKAYNDGKTLYILPCKVKFENMWIKPIRAHKDSLTTISSDGFNTTITRNREFETLVNAFTYYNCCNELGKYPAFFIEI